MNAGHTASSKTPKKRSLTSELKTPGKGQKTLISFLQAKVASKPTENSSRTSSSPSKQVPHVRSRGEPESPESLGDRETGKKRKLAQSNVEINPKREPKSKKRLNIVVESTSKMKHNQGDETQESRERKETLKDSEDVESMEIEMDFSLKENSFEDKIINNISEVESEKNRPSPKPSSKKLSPLRTVSDNMRSSKIKKEEKTIKEYGFDDVDEKLFSEAFEESFKDGGKKESETEEESRPKLEPSCLQSTLTDDFDDIFDDDWNGDMEVEVDLNELQRCKVTQISGDRLQNLIVDLLHVESEIPATVTLMGFWKETRLEVGDFVNIQARKQSNKWIVDNSGGFVVGQPDFLVSGTSVVGALFCARRGILSERFKGIESVTDCKQGASLMVIGSLVHELLQEVLKKKIHTKPGIAKLLKDILNAQSTASMLYSASMSSEACEKEMSPFVPKIFHFIERYVKDKPSRPTDDNFNGKINVIRDIEENLWVPQLGVKGKVDVTVEVGVNSRPRIMPLELKTGRASFSLEHRGQVILYTMMMAVTGQDVEAGLLLYLRENIMREVRVGHPERRDLILLRNNLAYYLTRKPEILSEEGTVPDSEFVMELPEPINHRACQTCPYGALCCAYLTPDESAKLSDRHPLTSMFKGLEAYLKPQHIEYVKKWVKMLRMEEADQIKDQSSRLIWTVSPRQREKRGKCLSNLKITGKVVEERGRYRHTFARVESEDSELVKDLTKSGFNEMEYIIVSTNSKVNVCAGPMTEISTDSVTVLLERNLWDKRPNDVFHIDAYPSQSLLILNLSNIGYLLDDTTVTEKMRKIVIDREPAMYSKKLDHSIAAIAAPILKPLNKTQQRAALRVLAAHDFLLIKGMPGSGKTLTLVAIIQLLVKLGKSVLLTAHTHSAVDNVLLKLMKTDVDFVRLGSSTKIHPSLVSKGESVLTKDCFSPESLDTAYNSKKVVCVTCLGANHPLLGRRMFDVCLVDESTQVLQSSILRPLYSASKFVLIGDPDQLPPVVKSSTARALGMDQSLFERLDSGNNTIVLTSQYRMNRRIMSIANRVTYGGQLTVGTDEIGDATLQIPNISVLNSTEEWVRAVLSTKLDDSVVAIDTGDRFKILQEDGGLEKDDYRAERRCSNLCEAAVILHLVTQLVRAGVVAENIGIIAPYREQVSLLKDIIGQKVEVNTVDQYQGRDKEIIFYSGTRSGSVKNDQEFNILDDHRRLTVAITRAKHKLIIIGDVRTLKEFLPFKKFFEHIRTRDLTLLKNGRAGFAWEKLLSVVK